MQLHLHGTSPYLNLPFLPTAMVFRRRHRPESVGGSDRGKGYAPFRRPRGGRGGALEAEAPPCPALVTGEAPGKIEKKKKEKSVPGLLLLTR